MSLSLKSVDPSYLAMMMRMGHKYDIDSLLSTALDYMGRLFPPTLEEFDACQREISMLCAKQNSAFIVDIINIAYDNHVSSILPAAFLSLWHFHSLVCLMWTSDSQLSLTEICKGNHHIRNPALGR